ncbi:hypothetical protein [Erythrobacter sp. JK5]|uniref:spike base protein, RCAP_Rcc01079 family n=1 Tax=Erythrobacter sp. JK5 TaxID=2829500 RepID=UPI001BA554FA|nr:hypothetical protein [Erythrobacter sp. JK5]QUL37668.1 hypothetical protein KDC96_15185 [Erythrobacter sp. JK5]
MPFDPFEHSSDSLIAPAKTAMAIVPDDAADLASAIKAIYIGTGGDIVARPVDSDSDVTFRNVAAGTVLAIRLRAVRASGTTAADLVGLA